MGFCRVHCGFDVRRLAGAVRKAQYAKGGCPWKTGTPKRTSDPVPPRGGPHP